MSVAYAVVVPARCGRPHPAPGVYVRRRLVVALCLVALVAAAWFAVVTVPSSRGSAPASAPAARPAAATTPDSRVHLVQPGETLWSIAAAHRGERSQSAYVDELVAANGGTALEVGQLLTLP